MTMVTIDGITHAYDDKGDGEAIVLVHGHPFDRSMWGPQADHFSRSGYRVIAPDLRGYGESTVVPGITPLETFARDIAGLLDHLGLGRVVLGGLSMGGQIVRGFHRLFPDRIRALVLAATSAPAETPEGRVMRTDMADRLLREGMAGHAGEVLPAMVAPADDPDLTRIPLRSGGTGTLPRRPGRAIRSAVDLGTGPGRRLSRSGRAGPGR
jgi:pimeloyl-ACP methyl ester carboxylesterase